MVLALVRLVVQCLRACNAWGGACLLLLLWASAAAPNTQHLHRLHLCTDIVADVVVSCVQWKNVHGSHLFVHHFLPGHWSHSHTHTMHMAIHKDNSPLPCSHVYGSVIQHSPFMQANPTLTFRTPRRVRFGAQWWYKAGFGGWSCIACQHHSQSPLNECFLYCAHCIRHNYYKVFTLAILEPKA